MPFLLRCFALSITVTLGLAQPVYAAEEKGGFAIEVPVEAMGKSLEEARLAAAVKGEGAAYAKLMETLAPQGADVKSGAVSPERIHAMIKGHEIAEEKMEGTRWHGVIRYRFDPAAFGGAAEPERLRPTLPPGRAVLILPVLIEKDKTLLWEKENRWRKVWAETALVLGRGNIVLPGGGVSDAEIVDAVTVRGADYTQAAPLLARYGAGDALVAEARLEEAERPALEVRARRIAKGENRIVYTERFLGDESEKSDALMKRAASSMAETLRNGTGSAIKLQQIADFKAEKDLAVTAPLRELADWPELRRRLEAVKPPVTRTELKSLAPARADLILYFTGDADTLYKRLTAAGLVLSRERNAWTLRTI